MWTVDAAFVRTLSTANRLGLPPRSREPFDERASSSRDPEATVTFRVNISALRALPEFLDRRDRDLHAAVTYLTAFAPIRDVAPLYRGMYLRHQANVATIAHFLADTAAYVSTDASRVRVAANAYTLA